VLSLGDREGMWGALKVLHWQSSNLERFFFGGPMKDLAYLHKNREAKQKLNVQCVAKMSPLSFF